MTHKLVHEKLFTFLFQHLLAFLKCFHRFVHTTKHSNFLNLFYFIFCPKSGQIYNALPQLNSSDECKEHLYGQEPADLEIFCKINSQFNHSVEGITTRKTIRRLGKNKTVTNIY